MEEKGTARWPRTRFFVKPQGKDTTSGARPASRLKKQPASARSLTSPRLGSRAIVALEKEREMLTEQMKALSESARDLPPGIENAPAGSSFLSGGKPVVAILINGKPTKVFVSDPIAYRMYEDAQRQIGRLQHELSEIDFLLSPPKGRPREGTYDQALREKLNDPKLTTRQLAERHFPFYFPQRADDAIRMLDQGLRRATRRAMKQRDPSK
jgi:hypothetical protein